MTINLLKETILQTSKTQDQAEREILSVIPNRVHDLARLAVFAQAGYLPVVTVMGKYNHGKSRLLNELSGTEAFAVADKREIVTLFEHIAANVRWLDAPGLDADVNGKDDRHALRAEWKESDIRLVGGACRKRRRTRCR